MSSKHTPAFPHLDLTGRVAIVTGGSRGIGRVTCLSLAKRGCKIVIAAKSIKATPTLPGTIYTVAEECRALGVEAIGIQLNVIQEESVINCVNKTIEKFGRIDILINNASALWWHTIKDTPMKKYDLIHSINARGTFCMSKYCLPHMMKGGWGRVVNMSPPIRDSGYRGSTAYNHSKMGMTMVAMGIAEEFEGTGITANALWPATVIESQAAINFKLGTPEMWRTAQILADCVLGFCEDGDYSGHAVIDDEYLRERHGFEDKDFVQYRVVADVEPVRALAMTEGKKMPKGRKFIRRGDVHKLRADMTADTGSFADTDTHRAKL